MLSQAAARMLRLCWTASSSTLEMRTVFQKVMEGKNYKLDYKHDRGIERRLNMLLMSTLRWILLIGVAVVILADGPIGP